MENNNNNSNNINIHNSNTDSNIITNNNNNNAIPTNTLSSPDAFRNIANALSDLYRIKNCAYGNSFSTSVQSYGLIAALTRISDKFHRLENLILHPNVDVGDERLVDTLKDLASYAIMTIMEVKNKK